MDPTGGPDSITEVRRIRASREGLWTLWTTREGLASWWAPEGFVLTVEVLEPRVDGRIDLRYQEAGAAHDPAWADELRKKGQATEFVARGVFTEMAPPERLAFSQELDFGPAGKASTFRAAVALDPEGAETRLSLTAASSPSKHWTSLGRSNVRAQLERLARVAEARER